jgi:ubiquitin-protein ligase
MVLGKGYPLIAPRVHIKDKLLLPGVNDCRDLLYTIIDVQYWDHKLTLKKIQADINRFLTRLYKSSMKSNTIYDIARFGHFGLNSIYPMEIIK